MTSTLFKECVEKLNPNVLILPNDESERIAKFFENTVHFGFASINWKKIPKKVDLQGLEDAVIILESLLQNTVERSVYIFWNNLSLPIIKSDLDSAFNHFDDVVCVGFETWFYNPYQGYVFEYRSAGELRVGLVPALNI